MSVAAEHRPFRTVYLRLLWKEYRSLRGFWISLLLFALLLQAVLRFLTGPAVSTGTGAGLYGIAFLVSTCYALGCGAVLFALEREDRTIDFLRYLPGPPSAVIAGKIVFGVVSSAMMLALLYVSAWMMTPVRLLPITPSETSLYVALVLEALGWGVLFSLICRHVLNALLLAVPAFLAGAWIVGAVPYAGHPSLSATTVASLFVLGHLLLGLMLVVSDVVFARRWIRKWKFAWSSLGPARLLTDSAARAISPRRQMLGRLIWQEWRQARGEQAWFLAIGTVVLLLGGVMLRFTALETSAPLVLTLLAVTPLVFGVWTFHAEQSGDRFRFSAEHGFSPRAVWLSKHLVWIPATVVVSLFFAFIVLIVSRLLKAHVQFNVTVTTTIETYGILIVLPSYAAGQLASMLFSRGVIALFVGMVLTIVLFGWNVAMLQFRVPVWFSILPVPAVLMIATLVRSRDWLEERRGIRAYVRLGSVLIGPAVLMVAGVIVWRVWEIPDPPPNWEAVPSLTGRSPMHPLDAEEIETADLYRRAAILLTPFPGPEQHAGDSAPVSQSHSTGSGAMTMSSFGMTEHPQRVMSRPVQAPRPPWQAERLRRRQWVRDNQQSLRLVLEATRRQRCAFSTPVGDALTDSPENRDQLDVLARLVQFAAEQLEWEGRLDEALEYDIALMRFGAHLAARARLSQWRFGVAIRNRALQSLRLWAAREGQNPERIRKAIDRVRKESFGFPPFVDAVNIEFFNLRRLLQQDGDESISFSAGRSAKQTTLLMLINRYCFWERMRALRLLKLVQSDVMMAAGLDEFNGPPAETVPIQKLTQRGEAVVFRPQNERRFLAGYSFFAGDRRLLQIQTTPLWPSSVPRERELIEIKLNAEVELRATQLVMALVAWRIERGHLPNRLDELTGIRLPQLLVDPWSGASFGYFKSGRLTRLSWFFACAPDWPFLWSAGAPWNVRDNRVQGPGRFGENTGRIHLDPGELFRGGNLSRTVPIFAIPSPGTRRPIDR